MQVNASSRTDYCSHSCQWTSIQSFVCCNRTSKYDRIERWLQSTVKCCPLALISHNSAYSTMRLVLQSHSHDDEPFGR